ncbi:SusC/RagA family TonB-linked outer membrane protein [Mucilaginibacter humi]|uniref:SusC/RagA family TonB-linked outer membrane protein n=1 Tax=Mucilaginibacter humi TaxID=2732510 RepID=UPI00293BA250|nr:SusC/RagA family TonB-linked outer membrane protein [Mucilaginibacter humi]
MDVSGKVTDQTGKALPGVTVKIKGSTVATFTNTEGTYSIRATDDDGTTVFSSIGFTTQEIAINKRKRIDVILQEEVSKLNEIVVVGYGTQKRKDLTGSVSSIGAKDIKLQPINSFNQALQGKVAGVQITQASNAPGGGITIRVRGTGSISGSNDPLYVVDGYPLANPAAPTGAANGGAPYANPLSTINPNDIESIEVLKDASATAIYGSRGANGVVIVTTRRGKAGQTAVDFETYTGTQRVTKMLELGKAMDHLNLKNEQLANLGFASRFGNPTGPYPKPVAAYGDGTNWQHEIFRDAIMQNYQVSITGGTEKTRYPVSANYLDQDGIVIENNFKRYATRFNLDAQLFENIKIGSNVTIARTLNKGVNETGASYSPVGAAVSISPASPVYDANGAGS